MKNMRLTTLAALTVATLALPVASQATQMPVKCAASASQSGCAPVSKCGASSCAPKCAPQCAPKCGAQN